MKLPQRSASEPRKIKGLEADLITYATILDLRQKFSGMSQDEFLRGVKSGFKRIAKLPEADHIKLYLALKAAIFRDSAQRPEGMDAVSPKLIAANMLEQMLDYIGE